MSVRRAVHAAGFRYRVHPREIDGQPDMVLPSHRIVVFVQGCFWHGHGCRIAHKPRTNSAYWRAKIGRNRKRDAKNMRLLHQQRWAVVSLWECSLRQDTAALIRRLKRHKARSAQLTTGK